MADLVWLLVRNNNSFLVKRNGVQFTSEPNNITNTNSFKYSGLANDKAIGIIPNNSSPSSKKAKGVTVVNKKTKTASYKPAKGINKVNLTKGVRKSAKSFINSYTKVDYRPDLRKV
ncbi:5878_t:CDS:2 [Diversispora eburnea]|uniref:5878_t:CDS:1 n=1 Tax=Diversispora eburnea TaxID=1213867 RepID=A0A9N8ZCH9_9GLOM|nr:5878_t:CDS:2 [Diversispora eburnea]